MAKVNFSSTRTVIPKTQFLRISNRRIRANISAVHFIDKDTLMHIVYLPSLDISGYGDTKEEAELMANNTVSDYFENLMELSSKNRDIELTKLGWKNKPFHNKEYSSAFVDIDGKLKNFNVVKDSVEVLNLEAV